MRRLESSHQRATIDLKNLATDVTQILQQKPEFSDLEAIAHKIHSKADNDKVQDLFGALKKEIVDTLTKIKKEQAKKKQVQITKAQEQAA